MSSGSDVVGAATSPPVGPYVSAFRVISDRTTRSRWAPVVVQRSDHSCHHAVVSATERTASIAGGAGSCDRCHVSTNGIRSPAPMLNSATVDMSSPLVSTGVRK